MSRASKLAGRMCDLIASQKRCLQIIFEPLFVSTLYISEKTQYVETQNVVMDFPGT